MKLLIVDDEAQIRESMTRYITGLKMGFTEIRTAQSGDEALQVCESFTPDLLIMDILMPGLDGIQTIGEIVTRHQAVQVIIISGCDDFQYVKNALRYPVQDYVLKPIHLPELNAALLRALEKRSEDQARDQALQRMGWFQEALPDMQERFLTALLHGRYSDRDYVDGTARALELAQLLDRPITVTAVTLRQSDGALGFSTLRRTLPDHLVPGDRMVWADDMLVAVLSEGTQVAELSEKIHGALIELERTASIKAVAGVGTPALDTMALSDSFRRACSAVQAAASGGARVVNAGDILLDSEAESPQARIKSDEVWALKGELFRGDADGLREFAAQAVSQLAPDGATTTQFWHAKLELTRVYIKLLQNMGAKPAGNPLASLAQLDALSGAGQLVDWVDARLLQLASDTKEQRRTRAESIARWMTAQIQARYAEPLSLQVFASETNLSVNYLSQVFSEHAGAPFLQYLTDCRMAHALELLGDPRTPISQIGAMTGYDNPNYFARLFRKRHGMSPSEYRERIT